MTCDASCQTIITPPAVCGNGVVETGEQCEPPNTSTCDAACQTITPSIPAHCGNSVWDGDESDLDCGGSCYPCPPVGCPTCNYCWENFDCLSGNCQNVAPLPILYNGITYTSYSQIRQLAQVQDTGVIPFQGQCV